MGKCLNYSIFGNPHFSHFSTENCTKEHGSGSVCDKKRKRMVRMEDGRRRRWRWKTQIIFVNRRRCRGSLRPFLIDLYIDIGNKKKFKCAYFLHKDAEFGNDLTCKIVYEFN